MFYKNSAAKELNQNFFRNPPAAYRGAPFWAWNCELHQDELDKQIEELKEMGFGGYHMHVRAGLTVPYLGEEYFERIKDCVKKGKSEGMLSWLYDEDRWPSGFAGGLVTSDVSMRARYLLLTPTPYNDSDDGGNVNISTAACRRNGKGTLLTRYDILLGADGTLTSYRRLEDGEEAAGTVWYAYLEVAADSARFNNQAYVNTLDKKAIDRFIEITHEKYKQELGHSFGTDCPAIFTDEPQFSHKVLPRFSQGRDDVILPWTDDLPETYAAAYRGEDIMAHLPQVVWDLPNGEVSPIRYHYHDHVCERFAEAFADNCGKWCEQNGIMMTGHMMEEPTLMSQSRALGEAMRCYRHFAIPGIDMLCDMREYNTAKQAASAVHQYGREGMMSEEYGVTGWDFDFRRHKLQGDWQAALGVTLRVPHLSWVSMEGEAKRDYPGSIHYQSPWYREYASLETHYARVNAAMTRGKPRVRVAVIHPIESFWLHLGPSDRNELYLSDREKRFASLTDWLLFGSVDFDFISESLIPELCRDLRNPCRVGEMTYDAVIVPGCETLRSTTVHFLEEFSKNGKLIFLGEAPRYVNALPTERAANLYECNTHIPFERSAVLEALAAYRDLEVRNADGSLTENLLYSMRQEGAVRYAFFAQGRTTGTPDVSVRQDLQIWLDGHWRVELLDTLSGDIREIPYVFVGGKTLVERSRYQYDSLLLRLTPTEEEWVAENADRHQIASEKTVETRRPMAFTLGEENAMVLDTAEYALDGSDWRGKEEILRIDTACRRELGWPEINGDSAQPWCIEEDKDFHTVTLRFAFESKIAYISPYLALEHPELCRVSFNGVAADVNETHGYFTDRSIRKVALSAILPGTNILEVTMPIGKRVTVEWCYLLGNFGVRCIGGHKEIVPLADSLYAGDITQQTLPFYSGKLTYHLDVETSGGMLVVRTPRYRAATLSVSVDDGEAMPLTYAPYRAFLPCKPGRHTLHITLYISRTNAFSWLHMPDTTYPWTGPDTWRLTGDRWCYEYALYPEGLLGAPEISEVFYE